MGLSIAALLALLALLWVFVRRFETCEYSVGTEYRVFFSARVVRLRSRVVLCTPYEYIATTRPAVMIRKA